MTWEKLRQNTLERDNYTCQQCYSKQSKLDVHHIIPRNHGGLDILNNLITVCRKCHYFIEPYFDEPKQNILNGFVAPIAKQGKQLIIIVPKSYHYSINKFKNPLKVTIEEIVE